MRVQCLASVSRLRIHYYHELWCRVQTWLRYGIAVAKAGSCSSDSTPSLGTSICCRRGPKKIKIKKGGPVVAQWVTNPTGNHGVAGLIPGLAQWAKDLASP